MRFERRWAWLGGVLVMTASLAACGGGSSTSSASAMGPTGPTGAASPAGAGTGSSGSSTGSGAAAAGTGSGSSSSGGTDSGSGSGSSTTQTSASASALTLVLSDASSSDWATVGVKVAAVALVPDGGGAPVPIYTAPSAPAMINLEQLDHIGQLLGTVSVRAGTYSGAIVTLSGNAGDVALTTSSAPNADVDATPSTAIPASQIQVQNLTGSSGSQTVAVPVSFASTVRMQSGAAPQALNINLPLSQPSFILTHQPVDGTATLYAITFDGAINADTTSDVVSMVLRQMYGTLSAVAADGASLTVTIDNPTVPVVSPETAQSSNQALTLWADTGNGTMVYDLDAQSEVTVSNFAAAAALINGRYIRIESRFESSGSLVATRLWVSSQFQNVWQSPEGHVTQFDAKKQTLTIEDDSGKSQTVSINDSTEFDFHGSAIGTGTAVLASGLLQPGFKVHVGLAGSTSLARTVDIEAAIFSGAISQASTVGLTYSSQYQPPIKNYTLALDYIAASSPNGTDAKGQPITGYDYWNFAFPSELASGPLAAQSFALATSGPVPSQGISIANWADPANPTGWALASTVLVPVPIGLATVTSALVTNGAVSTLTVLPAGSTTPLAVELINVSGSAPLVYQMQRVDGKGNGGNGNGNGNGKGNGNVTLSPVDITTAAGLAQLSTALQVGTSVRVFGLPKSDGGVQAYTLVYYTGVKPSN